MKVYLSVPLIKNRNKRVARAIASVIEELGHELISTWVLEDIHSQNLNIFERDTKGVRAADILIADVTKPSTGVGMEVMLAHTLGKPVVLVAKRESSISRMLLHMEKKKIIEFEKIGEMKEMLKRELIGMADYEADKLQ